MEIYVHFQSYGAVIYAAHITRVTDKQVAVRKLACIPDFPEKCDLLLVELDQEEEHDVLYQDESEIEIVGENDFDFRETFSACVPRKAYIVKNAEIRNVPVDKFYGFKMKEMTRKYLNEYFSEHRVCGERLGIVENCTLMSAWEVKGEHIYWAAAPSDLPGEWDTKAINQTSIDGETVMEKFMSQYDENTWDWEDGLKYLAELCRKHLFGEIDSEYSNITKDVARYILRRLRNQVVLEPHVLDAIMDTLVIAIHDGDDREYTWILPEGMEVPAEGERISVETYRGAAEATVVRVEKGDGKRHRPILGILTKV